MCAYSHDEKDRAINETENKQQNKIKQISHR